MAKEEFPALVEEDRVQCCNCTDIYRENEKSILVQLENGGYVRLTSDSPITAVIEPNGE